MVRQQFLHGLWHHVRAAPLPRSPHLAGRVAEVECARVVVDCARAEDVEEVTLPRQRLGGERLDAKELLRQRPLLAFAAAARWPDSKLIPT